MIPDTDYAFCRRVADGWLVLDKGSCFAMTDARHKAERRDCDNRYAAIRTGAGIGVGAIVPRRDYESPDDPTDSEFFAFYAARTAQPPKPAQPAPLPKLRQTMLLDHLDDLAGQRSFLDD